MHYYYQEKPLLVAYRDSLTMLWSYKYYDIFGL